MSAWRWVCEVETCGSVTLQFLTRKKMALCTVCGHISDKVKDMNTGKLVTVSARRLKDTGSVEELEENQHNN